MARYQDRDNQDDEDAVLKDGQALRVPTFLMDGLQRAVASTYGGTAFDASLHRPGYRAGDAAAQAARDEAYAKMCEDMSTAWRTPEQRAADSERAAEPPLSEDPREDAYLRSVRSLESAWRGPR